jgi:hypothetical protein
MPNPSEQEVIWDVGSMVVNSIDEDGKGLIRLNIHGQLPDGNPAPDVNLQGTPDQALEAVEAMAAAIRNAIAK